jgi:Ca-activated chloride channel family protein
MLRRKILFALCTASLVVACAQPPREQAQEQESQARSEPLPAEPPAAVAAAAAEQARAEARHKAARQQSESVAADAATGAAGAVAPLAPPSPAPRMAFAPGSGDVLGGARYAPHVQDTEKYQHLDESAVLRAAEHPVSTFSIDVDTGAYSNVRRMLRDGALPRQDAVRVEELINYFDYAYAPPRDRSQPFAVHTELAPTPWNAKTLLLRIGLQGWQPQGALPPSNLVFLVDVSGSMDQPDKLPLVKQSLKLLVNELGPRDRIALVVYAGASGVVLEPTPGDRRHEIFAAIDRLEAGGSTNGAEGIQLAYAMAQRGYVKDGINRVLLATDGDFNVGIVDFEQLKDLVEEKRQSGVALSTLGFGTGNYNDHLMEQLADAGNGNYTYVDGLLEARRALVQMRAATLQTIAKDVKIQVEFNPAVVAEYRLIGYENRALKREDFNNDQVDAGEIGAGHSVTALYEVALRGSGGERVDPLRFQAGDGKAAGSAELAFLRLRYKAPDGDASKLIERSITRRDMAASIDQASPSLRFAAAVSAFGQLLRGGRYTERFGYADVLRLARAARGDDAAGWKGEFVQLVELAQSLSTHAAKAPGQEIGH